MESVFPLLSITFFITLANTQSIPSHQGSNTGKFHYPFYYFSNTLSITFPVPFPLLFHYRFSLLLQSHSLSSAFKAATQVNSLTLSITFPLPFPLLLQLKPQSLPSLQGSNTGKVHYSFHYFSITSSITLSITLAT